MKRQFLYLITLLSITLAAGCRDADDDAAPTPAEGVLSGVPSLSQLAGTPAPEIQPLPELDAGEIARGQELYAIHCASCHGLELEGEADWQLQDENGTFRAPPHNASGHTWHHGDKLLLESIRLGGTRLPDDIGGVSEMPAFEGVLDEQQMRAILTYIKSTWPEDIRQVQWEQTAREP
ncbi:MAG: c-type cytochrome [Chloroflexota bacterium]|jgi:mono/diheme cytochrome c family protein